jgi:RimJ/RimL family protein N-acetyltransferase
MIELRFYRPQDFAEINYILSEEQLQFTALPKNALERIKERKDGQKHAICIVYEDSIVGFFVLDTSDDKKDLSENEQAILLRSLSINPLFQGKGIAKKAMFLMPNFVKNSFPDCNEIVLAVNFQNSSAYQLYLKTNFVDEGKTNLGRNGLQYVLKLKLQ